ncbi:DUF1490 family protein [Phytomonospora endophytica]|uniref:Uncharacterized protein n=1 Tax=Phytomonospora endophytica TaxID=714109 RepID=A0A841FY01_9ACTN|nr:DUF1490 family protein [Phytomonospora endophytica]MBB6039603.1 hypothetical protein [Phytomonospora endophytica]GIG65679.1 hypothetical protein Pen01_19740 [Phytomonospora endophytica]
MPWRGRAVADLGEECGGIAEGLVGVVVLAQAVRGEADAPGARAAVWGAEFGVRRQRLAAVVEGLAAFAKVGQVVADAVERHGDPAPVPVAPNRSKACRE